jgi:hypothetical protein
MSSLIADVALCVELDRRPRSRVRPRGTLRKRFETPVLCHFTGLYVSLNSFIQVAFGPAMQPVGGFMEPVNSVAIAAPYLALFGIVAAVAIIVWKRPEN